LQTVTDRYRAPCTVPDIKTLQPRPFRGVTGNN